MYTPCRSIPSAAEHAAFSIAALVASYGAMQVVVSPVIGHMIDGHRWTPIMWAADAHAHARLRRPVDREAARVKQRLKRWFFRLLGKDPEAVVVSFVTGDAALCARMVDEVRALVPDRRHFVATPENWPELRRELRGYRIGLAPGHAHARSERPSPRGVSPGSAQDPGLQLAAGTASSPA